MREIFTRVSIRKFTDQPVEKEKLEKLLRAAMAAPSAGNQQPWEFLIVEDKETLVKLAGTSPNAPPAKNAAAAVVLLCDTKRLRREHMWQQDLSAATENLLLEAVHLGLGAVWLGIAPVPERMENVTALFNLPKHVLPFAIVALGYPSEGKVQEDRYDQTRVYYESYKSGNTAL